MLPYWLAFVGAGETCGPAVRLSIFPPPLRLEWPQHDAWRQVNRPAAGHRTALQQ